MYPERNLTVGDVVLINDDGAHRSQWQLARVSEVRTSSDGHVRSATVIVGDRNLDKQGKRIHPPHLLERPSNKLVLLLEAVTEDSSSGSQSPGAG